MTDTITFDVGGATGTAITFDVGGVVGTSITFDVGGGTGGGGYDPPIPQSDVTDLVTDLANRAKLDQGNRWTDGTQVFADSIAHVPVGDITGTPVPLLLQVVDTTDDPEAEVAGFTGTAVDFGGGTVIHGSGLRLSHVTGAGSKDGKLYYLLSSALGLQLVLADGPDMDDLFGSTAAPLGVGGPTESYHAATKGYVDDVSDAVDSVATEVDAVAAGLEQLSHIEALLEPTDDVTVPVTTRFVRMDLNATGDLELDFTAPTAGNTQAWVTAKNSHATESRVVTIKGPGGAEVAESIFPQAQQVISVALTPTSSSILTIAHTLLETATTGGGGPVDQSEVTVSGFSDRLDGLSDQQQVNAVLDGLTIPAGAADDAPGQPLGAADNGTSDYFARADHVHPYPTAAIAAQISTAIDALLDGAPGALDTLNELAAAINDDASFAATVTTALAGKLGATAAAGGDLTGNYPNPTIGTGKVTSSHILDGTIAAGDLATALLSRIPTTVVLGTQRDSTSQTLADTTGMGFSVTSGQSYHVRMIVQLTGDSAGDAKLAVTNPGGTMNLAVIGPATSASSAPANVGSHPPLTVSGTSLNIGTVTGGTTVVVIEGTYVCTTSGTLQLQHSRNSATGTTSVLVGSLITYATY